MSYIFISHFLHEELDCGSYDEDKKDFTRSIRAITGGPDEDGWIKTDGYGSNIFFKWWIDPIEYPELKVVYL